MEASAVRNDDLASEAGQRWWMFLVSGTVWAIIALTVFRFDIDSAGVMRAIVGVFCIVAGVQQFATVGVASTESKIVHVILGLLFVAVGVLALVYPHRLSSR